MIGPAISCSLKFSCYSANIDRTGSGKCLITQWSREMNKLVLVIIAILLPPLAVFLKSGAGKDLLINILLCLLMYVPGILHALWLILK